MNTGSGAVEKQNENIAINRYNIEENDVAKNIETVT